MTGIDEVEAFGNGIDGAGEQTDLGVELARGKIVGGNFRSDDQANIFQIGGAGLIAGLRGFDAAAAGADEIDFIADSEGNREIVLGDRAAGSDGAVGRTIAGDALAFESGRGGELRELRGNLNGGERASLFEARGGNFYSLVGCESFFFERGEIVIVKYGPPFAFAEGVFGSAFAPGFGDVPMRGGWSGGALVFWADGAAGEGESGKRK